MKNLFKRAGPTTKEQLAEAVQATAILQNELLDMRREMTPAAILTHIAELDPRLLSLIIQQSGYEQLIGSTDFGAGLRRNAVESMRLVAAPNGDVQIGNAIETWTDWGFGRKVDIVATDPNADKVWQECWKAPRNKPVFGQPVIHELSRDLLVDGEVFFIATASRLDGDVTWRTFDTLAITEILHPKNDKSVNVYYVVQLEEKQVAIPDAFTWYALKDRFEGVALPSGVENINDATTALEPGGTFALIVAAQRNRDADGRGWPQFVKAVPWSGVYSQMLKEYSAVFSAVAMFVDKLKIKGGSRTSADIVAALQSSLVNTTGSYIDTNPRPASGSTWVENEAADRTRLPLGSAAGDAQTGTLTVGTQLATALGVKLSDIGRPDAFQNKATADIAAESPQQKWQRYQLFWTSVWSDIVETTLRLKEEFGGATFVKFASYESAVSTSLPTDIETTDLAAAMDSVTRAATGGALDFGMATRSNAALLKLMLLDLGVDDAAEIIEPPQPQEGAPPLEFAQLGESHTAVSILHLCPLCGASDAYSYEGHGPLLVCAECGKTYDPEVE